MNTYYGQVFGGRGESSVPVSPSEEGEDMGAKSRQLYLLTVNGDKTLIPSNLAKRSTNETNDSSKPRQDSSN